MSKTQYTKQFDTSMVMRKFRNNTDILIEDIARELGIPEHDLIELLKKGADSTESTMVDQMIRQNKQRKKAKERQKKKAQAQGQAQEVETTESSDEADSTCVVSIPTSMEQLQFQLIQEREVLENQLQLIKEERTRESIVRAGFRRSVTAKSKRCLSLQEELSMLQTRVEAISQEIATCMQEIDVANVEIQKHTDCINSLDSSEEDCREKIKSLDEQIEKLEKQYIFLLAPTFEEPIKRGVANERYISTVAHIVADISVEVAHATAVTPSDIGFAEELGLMAESGYTDAKTFERDLEFALLVNEITIVQPEAVVNVIGESQPLSILIALTANLFDEL